MKQPYSTHNYDQKQPKRSRTGDYPQKDRRNDTYDNSQQCNHESPVR